MNVNEPSPLSFADKLTLPKVEDSMTAEQKYWYNKGHEDGLALTAYNKPRVEALESEIEALKAKLEKTDAFIDQAYCNGAAAGFNCDTHEELAKIRESRSGYLAELKRVKS